MTTLQYIISIIAIILTISTTLQAHEHNTTDTQTQTYDDEDNTIKVIELTDANLGSLTQIDGNSMTSGDWFVAFTAPWCGHCKSLHPTWIALADELHGIVNVASVNAIENEQSAQRFEIKGFPTLYYLHHQGYMYEYDGPDRTLKSLKDWALDMADIANATETDGKPIPPPPTTWQRFETHFNRWSNDMERVITQHLAVTISLITFGILLGVALTCIILMLTLEQPAPPVYKPIPKEVKKTQ